MKTTGDDITIEDLLTAIANHTAIEKGRNIMRSCGGNVAIV
jgi:hypothetical protein